MSESYNVVKDSPYPCIQIEREYWCNGEPAGTIVIELTKEILEKMLADLQPDDSFTYEGNTYIAVDETESGSCDRCCFYALSDACAAHNRPSCDRTHRPDGRGIIWRRK